MGFNFCLLTSSTFLISIKSWMQYGWYFSFIMSSTMFSMLSDVT
jgi:hypothetical protein